MEHAVTGFSLFRLTKDPHILETVESIFTNSFDWTSYYETFPWDSQAVADGTLPLNWKADGLTAHVVNNGTAVKYPGLWYQQSKDKRHRDAVYAALEKYDQHHGQIGGRFSGDEHLAGRRPTQGTELCAVVEFMFSLEVLLSVLGDPAFGDRLEKICFNALPATFTLPRVGFNNPSTSFSSVVLPPPLGPITATKSPSSMTRSIPCSTSMPL